MSVDKLVEWLRRKLGFGVIGGEWSGGYKSAVVKKAVRRDGTQHKQLLVTVELSL
jgi:hypothetical protein